VISLSLVDALGQEINLNGLDWFVNIMLFKENNLTEMVKDLLGFISLSSGIDTQDQAVKDVSVPTTNAQ
jgi:hypothetical protein